MEYQQIRPSNKEPDPPLGEKNNILGYEICPASQAELSTVEDAPEVMDDDHNLPDIMDYPGDIVSLLQTPPDSTKEDKDDVLFEPHAIYHTRNESLDSSTARPLNLNSPNSSVSNHTLPAYIKRLPPSVSEEDFDYLAKRGALVLPPDDLRTSLLRSYIDFVHPYMPILSLRHILIAIDQETGEEETISLLLFQAIMFAGATFADASCLTRGGFETRKLARRVLFHRARLLYDFGCEQDEITLIQSFLLLTYWFEGTNDEKNTWHWLALSTSLCHTIGLHRNPENSENRHQVKRIWWSCFTRDRLVALATKSPTIIKIEECDVPLLTADDFEILDGSWNRPCAYGSSFLADENLQKKLALMFVEKSKLCICLGQVLTAHKRNKEVSSSDDSPSRIRGRMMLLAPDNHTPLSTAQIEDYSLAKWATNLPDEAVYRRPSTMSFNKSSTLHSALLQMLYFSTTIYAAITSVTGNQSTVLSNQTSSNSAEKTRLAALEITDIAHDLYALNLLRYLPTSGVTPVILASIIHLQCIVTGRLNIKKSGLVAFHQCLKIMQILSVTYFSAEAAFTLMMRAAKKIGVCLTRSSSPQRAPPGMGEPDSPTERFGSTTSGLSARDPARQSECPVLRHPSVHPSGTKISSATLPRTMVSGPIQNNISGIEFGDDGNLFAGGISHFFPDDLGLSGLLESESLDSIFENDTFARNFMQF